MNFGKIKENFLGSFTFLIFKDRFFQIFLGLSLLLNLIIWIFLYFKFYTIGDSELFIPLHYNIYFGIDLVGDWKKIFNIPLVGIFFIFINFLISDIIYLRDKVIGYFLVGTGLFIQILLGVAVLMIAMIN